MWKFNNNSCLQIHWRISDYIRKLHENYLKKKKKKVRLKLVQVAINSFMMSMVPGAGLDCEREQLQPLEAL